MKKCQFCDDDKEIEKEDQKSTNVKKWIGSIGLFILILGIASITYSEMVNNIIFIDRGLSFILGMVTVYLIEMMFS